MNYRTQLKATGDEIDKFETREEAEQSIIGEEDFCEVAEIDENGNWLPCSYLDERAMKSAAAATLGSIKTAKKAASSRENGKKGGRPKKQVEK